MTTEYFTREGAPFEPNIRTGSVKVIDDHRATVMVPHKCSRCGGAGGADKWRPTGWTCFQCGGAGYLGMREIKLYSQEKLAKLNATRDKQRAKKEAVRSAMRAAAEAEARAQFAGWLKTETGQAIAEASNTIVMIRDELGDELAHCRNDFYHSAVAAMERTFEKGQPVTDKQAALVLKAVASYNKKKAEKEASRHLGDIGEAVEIEGDCRLIWEDPYGAYGYRGLWIIKTPIGDAKYSGKANLPRAGHVRLTATVGGLSEYKGACQTIIKRPRKIEVDQALC